VKEQLAELNRDVDIGDYIIQSNLKSYKLKAFKKMHKNKILPMYSHQGTEPQRFNIP